MGTLRSVARCDEPGDHICRTARRDGPAPFITQYTTGQLRVGFERATSWRPEPAQEFLARPTGDRLPEPLLLHFHRLAGAWREHGIDRADVMAAREQQGLHLAPFRARQPRIIGGPGPHERAATAQPVASATIASV